MAKRCHVIEFHADGIRAAVTVQTPLGEVWVWAGVMPQDEDSARACRNWEAYATVEPFGTCPTHWLPEGADPDEALELATDPALAAWRAL